MPVTESPDGTPAWRTESDAWFDRIAWSAHPEMQSAVVSDLSRFHRLLPAAVADVDPGTYWALIECLPAYQGACWHTAQRLLAEPATDDIPLDPAMAAFLQPGETVAKVSPEQMASMTFV